MLKIDVSNILTRKKAIEPSIVEVQKGVDVSSDDDDYDNNELNFNGASTKRKIAKIAWIFLKQLESEFVVDYEIKPNYSRYRSYDAYGGTKVYYKCKFKSCSVQVYLFYCKNPLKISLFSNHREHQHINDKGKKRAFI
ncbi:hypothetical protein BpHYR1_033669 [Brachionus plicatilis]|uniref:Uncharacterized protein n=1 Tax=Brachionus plicatilis TaxID=10195 RepID=A0A3M7QPK8_BRAPC|nr:hypothetical protein BpHYR1_033669 [Brachionus plicatilis]